MDAELLIPATAALLEKWFGPVEVLDHEGWCEQPMRGAALAFEAGPTPDLPSRPGARVVVATWHDDPRDQVYIERIEAEHIRLDLSRAECRDRVARVLASARWPDEDLVASSAPRWFCGWLRTQPQWVMEAEVVRHAPDGRRYGGCVHADWDLGLDPRDDTRLPDGSRRVDALALAIVAREVLRG